MSNILKMLKYGPYSPNYDFQTYIDGRTNIKVKHATKEKRLFDFHGDLLIHD